MKKYSIKTIHPFPARMAPEIALQSLENIPKDAIVLDPMIGSGTTLKVAGILGLKSIGFDVEPLALMISKVWNCSVDTAEVRKLADQVIAVAKKCELPKLR